MEIRSVEGEINTQEIYCYTLEIQPDIRQERETMCECGGDV